MSCRCQVNAEGLMTASGTSTGADPRVISLTCAAVLPCVESMFDDIGFEWDPDLGQFVVPTGTTADFVLTAVGDGTAVWAAAP